MKKNCFISAALISLLTLGLAFVSCENGTTSSGNSSDIFTVEFDGNGNTGGKAPKDIAQESKGEAITLPGKGTLVNTGNSFGGWNTEYDGTGTNYAVGSEFTPTADITLYARWIDTADALKVTFNSNGGSTITSLYVEEGEKITKPADPIKSGSVFDGWYKETGTINKWNFNTGTVNADITLFAKWIASNNVSSYTVTFDGNGNTGGKVPKDITQESEGAAITLPGKGTLVNTGNIFGGWNTKADGTGTNYAEGSAFTPTDDITLHAKWQDAYTVTFSNEGGTGVEPQTVVEGEKLIEPAEPTNGEDTFDGWYKDDTKWDFDNYTVTADITLYAKWIYADHTEEWNIEDFGEGVEIFAKDIAIAELKDYLEGLTAGNYVVNLTDSGNLPEGDISLYTDGVKVSLRGNSNTIKNTVAQNSMFEISGFSAETSLILRDITLDGDNLSVGSWIGHALVEVSYKGVFTMKSGSKITNVKCNNSSSAAAVNVERNGTFYMEGGEISGNTGANGGGVLVNKGNFYKTGGAITGNTWYGNSKHGDQVHVEYWDQDYVVYHEKFINAALGPTDDVSVKANYAPDEYGYSAFVDYTYSDNTAWLEPQE